MIFKITTKPSVKSMVDFNYGYRGSEVFLTYSKNYTNHHWILKPEYVTKTLKKRFQTTGGVNETTLLDDTKLFDGKGYTQAKYVHSLEPNGIIPQVAIFKNIAGIEIAYDEKYIAWLQKNIPDFGLKTRKDLELAFIMSGNKVAGLIMPVKMD